MFTGRIIEMTGWLCVLALYNLLIYLEMFSFLSWNSTVIILGIKSFSPLLLGRRISGSQVTASFTADGKHIVSASEDSNIYIWDYVSQDVTHSRAKNIWSC